MSQSQTPTISQFPLWESNDNQGATPVERYETMVSPADMKRRSLFGIPLKSFLTGETVSDETLQDYINQSISEVEHSLDIYITPCEFQEKHDYNREFFTWSYAYIKLYHPNVVTVKQVAISFSNSFPDPITQQPQPALIFPNEYVHILPQEGALQLVPAVGTTIGGFVASVFFGVQFNALWFSQIMNYPGSLRITYTAGFQPGKIPALIVSIVETIAAIKFLSTLGPVLFPHNSVSIGIDGASQSTSTMGPLFMRQRVEELKQQLEQQMATAKGYYQRSFLIDYI